MDHQDQDSQPAHSRRRIRLKFLLSVFAIALLIPFLFSGKLLIPVQHASKNDWHQDTFWYEPWGVSGVHKGIDIFAESGRAVINPTPGLVLFTGDIRIGGKVVVSIGPKWRIHYFAHLDSIQTHAGQWLSRGEVLGTVGDSGNARGKQPHLHYSHLTLLPYVWRIDTDTQGWKKAFYLNPIDYFE